MGKHAPQVDASRRAEHHTDGEDHPDGEEMCFPLVKLSGRDFRGDLDIRIDACGGWHYNHYPVEDKTMVCLFASMLMLDARGRHWLVTPTELGRIEVEDAPFIAEDLFVCGEGRTQVISIFTNVDRLVSIGPDAPLTLSKCPTIGSLTPYIIDERSLKIKVDRAVHDDLVELGVTERLNGQDLFGVWSSGLFFPLGQMS